MKYKSEQLRKKALSEMNWETRMFVLVKLAQKWSVRQIAEKLGLSTQRVHAIKKQLDNKTVEELEKEYNNYLLTTNK